MENNLSRREVIGALGAAGITTGLGSKALMAKGTAGLPRQLESPNVVFVTGDDEYRSEVSMPMIAKILEAKHGFKCPVIYAVDPGTGKPNPKYQQNIEGLEALKTADLAVFFLRFRALPDDQLKLILVDPKREPFDSVPVCHQPREVSSCAGPAVSDYQS